MSGCLSPSYRKRDRGYPIPLFQDLGKGIVDVRGMSTPLGYLSISEKASLTCAGWGGHPGM
jgi:hypothetical protein